MSRDSGILEDEKEKLIEMREWIHNEISRIKIDEKNLKDKIMKLQQEISTLKKEKLDLYQKINEFSTVLYFHNHDSIKIDVKYNIIDNQIVRCIKLDSLLKIRRDFIEKEKIVCKELI